MKIKFMILVLLVACLLFAGCVEEPANSNNGEENDNTENGDNNDNAENDNQTVTAGWYLKEIVDYDDKDPNTIQYDVQYTRGDITTTHNTTNGQYFLKVRSTWTAPPEYIEEEGEFSITVVKEVLSLYLLQLGYLDTTGIHTDGADIDIGFGTASILHFSDETYGTSFSAGLGDAEGDIKQATFTGPAPIKDGPYGNEFGLTISFQNGPSYGTKYIYEWRE